MAELDNSNDRGHWMRAPRPSIAGMVLLLAVATTVSASVATVPQVDPSASVAASGSASRLVPRAEQGQVAGTGQNRAQGDGAGATMNPSPSQTSDHGAGPAAPGGGVGSGGAQATPPAADPVATPLQQARQGEVGGGPKPSAVVSAVPSPTSLPVLQAASSAPSGPDAWTATRLSAPSRTVIRDAAGALVAELTDGARTVLLAGPTRTWHEPGVSVSVSTMIWVRLLPVPYDGSFGSVERDWLVNAAADRSPDVLAIAFEYVAGAPTIERSGLRIAGDADWGALQADGTRVEGSDFNDFLGVLWTYGTTVDQPETGELGSLDCSGYVRMVYGYRLGMPMALAPNGVGLPRRARYQAGYGVSIPVPQVGDLVFFDASTDDGAAIDHVGIYLGVDSAGHRRFISSRKKANGPTMGDVGGASIIDGGGYWAAAFRAVRRI